MNISFRKIIYKIPGLHSLCIKVVDRNNQAFYKRFNSTHGHDGRLRALKNTKCGKRCFIVGNGPSLTMDDLALIKDEDCFAANLIFKVFESTSWRPRYYFLQDRYADTAGIVDELDVETLFIGDYYWRVRGMSNPNALCFHGKRGPKSGYPEFSEDISEFITDHYTVTFSMLQCALYMGYSQVYLLGMDHNYAFVCDAEGNVIKGDVERSHVFDDENSQEVVANLEGMNKAYLAARDYASANGVKIVNCTRGGRLEWFPRGRLEDIVRE